MSIGILKNLITAGTRRKIARRAKRTVQTKAQSCRGFYNEDTPFPTACPHYLVEEYQLDQIEELSDILLAMAKVLPKPKKKKRKNLRS